MDSRTTLGQGNTDESLRLAQLRAVRLIGLRKAQSSMVRLHCGKGDTAHGEIGAGLDGGLRLRRDDFDR